MFSFYLTKGKTIFMFMSLLLILYRMLTMFFLRIAKWFSQMVFSFLQLIQIAFIGHFQERLFLWAKIYLLSAVLILC